MYYREQFICAPSARYPSSHAANLVVLPNGQLAMVCFRGSREGAQDTVAMMFVLQTDGFWDQGRVVADEPGHSVGNSVLMPLPDGRVLLFYTLSYSKTRANWADSLIHYRFSEDGGATFGPRCTLTEEFGFICRHPALILSNGEWLLPIYDNRGGGKPEYAGMGGNESSVAISADGGQHWSRYGRMVADAGTAQPSIVELEGGHLMALLRTRNYWNGENPAWAWIYRADSYDYGRNWSRPAPIALPNNNSGLQLLRLDDKALVLAYNHQGKRLRSPLNISLSYDEGQSWPICHELEAFASDGSEYSYPALAQTPDGIIHVAYTYRRTHIKHVAIDEEWLHRAPWGRPEASIVCRTTQRRVMTKLIEVEGVGEAYAAKLEAAGIPSLEALLKEGSTPRGRQALSEKTGISGKLILEWVNHADLFRVKGIGSEYSDLLEEVGVDTVPELAQRKPENLYKALAEINQQKKLVRRLPSLDQVSDWVEQAKKLPRIISY